MDTKFKTLLGTSLRPMSASLSGTFTPPKINWKNDSTTARAIHGDMKGPIKAMRVPGNIVVKLNEGESSGDKSVRSEAQFNPRVNAKYCETHPIKHSNERRELRNGIDRIYDEIRIILLQGLARQPEIPSRADDTYQLMQDMMTMLGMLSKGVQEIKSKNKELLQQHSEEVKARSEDVLIKMEEATHFRMTNVMKDQVNWKENTTTNVMAKLKAENNILKSDNERLENKIKTKEKEIRDMRGTHANEKEQFSKQIKTLECEAKEMASCMVDLQASKNKYKKEAAALNDRLMHEENDLRQTNLDLDKKRREKKQAREEADRYKACLDAATIEIDQLKRNERWETNQTEVINKLHHERNQLFLQNTELLTKNRELQREIDQNKVKAKPNKHEDKLLRQVIEIENELQEKQHLIDSHESTVKAFQSELDKKENQIARLVDELQTFTQFNGRNDGHTEGHETHKLNEEISTLQELLKSVYAENKKLMGQIKEQNNELVADEEANERGRGHNVDLKTKSEGYKRQVSELQVKVKELDNNVMGLQVQLRTEKSAVKQKSEQLHDKQNQIVLLTKRVEQIENSRIEWNKIQEQTRKNAYESGDREGYQRGKLVSKEKLEELQIEIDARASMAEELTQTINKLETEKAELNQQHKQQLEQAQRTIEGVMQQHEEEKRQNEALLQNELHNVARISSKVKEVQNDNAQLVMKVNALECEQTERENRREGMSNIAYDKGFKDGYENGEIEIGKEIQRLKSEISALTEHKTTLSHKLNQNENALKDKTKELLVERKAVSAAQRELHDAKDEIKRLQDSRQIQSNQDAIYELHERMAIKESEFEQERLLLKQQNAELQEEINQTQRNYQKLADDHSRTVNRLAAEMNAKVSSDESSLENISIQARPMKIAEDYSLLLSNVWLDAKSALDEVIPEDSMEADKVTLLFDILMICEQESKALYAHIVQELSQTLRDPIHRLVQNDESASTKGSPVQEKGKQAQGLPQNVLTVIGDYFRSMSGTANLHNLYQRVIRVLTSKYSDKSDQIIGYLQLEDVSDYVTDSVRLAWKMVIQRPPMTFDASQLGKPWHKDSLLELTWGSDPKAPNAVILYYKGPMLRHAGKTMVKGSVFVHNEK